MPRRRRTTREVALVAAKILLVVLLVDLHAVFATKDGVAGSAGAARIYVYSLPGCALDDFAEDVDLILDPNPPVLPIHRRIVGSSYVTTDPSEATLFYIPAPFGLWQAAGHEAIRLNFSVPIHHDTRGPVALAGEGLKAPVPHDVQAVSGGGARTISIWAKVEAGNAVGSQILVSTGGGIDGNGETYDLGFVGGCLAVLSCNDRRHASACGQGLDDGRWHHLAATFDGTVSHLFVDGRLVGKSRLVLDTHAGGIRYGVRNGCDAAGPLSGFVQDLRLFDYALVDTYIPTVFGGPRTAEVPCMREVREHVEASPWFQLKTGWDHFVLIGSMDYPVGKYGFQANLPDFEDSYVLELAWPAFGRFALLHLGSRSELCASIGTNEMANDPSCIRRLFRVVTIPPYLTGENFDCAEMAARASDPRHIRIAYRGLAYVSMVERMAMLRAARNIPDIVALQRTGQIRLEFTNWTHEMVGRGACRPSFAFDGLCPWGAVGRGFDDRFGTDRKRSMKSRSLSLWPKSETCLALPGDGGYELRLYSMINMGCIPVIVFTSGLTHPKIPFPAQLPWNEFVIFWDLSKTYTGSTVGQKGSDVLLESSGQQLIWQLLALSPDFIKQKREALLRHGPKLGWMSRASCGGASSITALDLLVNELTHRANFPEGTGKITSQDLLWKIPVNEVRATMYEDASSTGCPLGFPHCMRLVERYGIGDLCQAFTMGVGHRCPLGCREVPEPPWCLEGGEVGDIPCHAPKCLEPTLLRASFGLNGFPQPPMAPRLALVSFSTQPRLGATTRPSLRRFHAAHPGRYDLDFQEEPLLDERDFHSSWNRLAIIRRAFTMDEYDAVVWIDEDILITAPWQDPFSGVITNELFARSRACVLAARGLEPWNVDVSVLIMKRGWDTLDFIGEVFRIGRRLRRARLRARNTPFRKVQLAEAFDAYLEANGLGKLVLVAKPFHSSVQGKKWDWTPGDFALRISSSKLRARPLRMMQAKKRVEASCNLTSFDARERCGAGPTL